MCGDCHNLLHLANINFLKLCCSLSPGQNVNFQLFEAKIENKSISDSNL